MQHKKLFIFLCVLLFIFLIAVPGSVVVFLVGRALGFF